MYRLMPLSRLPWENTQVDHVEPLIVKTMLQSKLETKVGITDVNPQLNSILKSMVVDSSPKLTHDDWVKEQFEDPDIGLMVQLLKSYKLKNYVAKEMDSPGIQVLLKIQERSILEEWIIVSKSGIKNHSGPVFQFVLPRNFVCKVILACHDDNGHLGMERT